MTAAECASGSRCRRSVGSGSVTRRAVGARCSCGETAPTSATPGGEEAGRVVSLARVAELAADGQILSSGRLVPLVYLLASDCAAHSTTRADGRPVEHGRRTSTDLSLRCLIRRWDAEAGISGALIALRPIGNG
jgi:hypothetical protein